MNTSLALVGLFSLPLLLASVACSGDADSTTEERAGGSGTDDTSDSPASGDDTCTCSVSYNGVKKSMTCGESACVNGVSFSCTSSGSKQGDSCADSDTGTTTDAGATFKAGQCSQKTTGTPVASAKDQCAYCIETNCCDELKTCKPGSDCDKYEKCDLACVAQASTGGDYAKCVAACKPAAGGTARESLYSCRKSSCSAVCPK